MIKKIKIILVLFILMGIALSPLKKVNAHSIELDPNSLIDFPIVMYGGKGNITIRNSETGYTLYYQAVEISNSIYSQIQQISEDGKKEIEEIKTDLDALKIEYNNLKAICDEKYKTYTSASEDQKEQAKIEYEEANKNYQEKVEEYNNKVKESNEKRDEIAAKINELTPTYVESNWIKTDDDSFFVDLSMFSGQKAFVIWVKLVSSNGTISYDEATYTMSGTKTDEIKVKSISLDKTDLSINEGDNYTLTATVTPNNATNKLVDWSSDNENIAKVENGKITAISEGTAIITAKTIDGEFTATCKVTVTKKVVTQKPGSTDNNKEDETKKYDMSISKEKLPQTGSTAHIIVFIIIILSVVGIVCYKKIKFYNFK